MMIVTVMKTETTTTTGRTVLALHGKAILDEIRDPSPYGSRFTNWRIDGEKVGAFIDVTDGAPVVNLLLAAGVGTEYEVVLVRTRKLKRKDGTPIPQSGPWNELDVFNDTITSVGVVNGVSVAGVPPVKLDVATITQQAVAAPTASDSPTASTPLSPRTRETDMTRLQEAINGNVPRSIIVQMAAIMILDGASPLEVKTVVASRKNALPEQRIIPNEAPAARREISATVNAAPIEAAQTPTLTTNNPDLTGTPATPTSTKTPTVPTAPTVTINGIPAPRRVRRSIDDAQLISLQRLATLANIDPALLNMWALHQYGRGIRNISHEEADTVIKEFRSKSKEEGINLFTNQVKEALNAQNSQGQ
jgi:hypothetical protein